MFHRTDPGRDNPGVKDSLQFHPFYWICAISKSIRAGFEPALPNYLLWRVPEICISGRREDK